MGRRYLATISLLFTLAFASTSWADPPAAGPPAPADVASAAPATQDSSASAAADSWPGTVDDFARAVRAGNWRLVAAFAIAGAMFGLRKARDRVAWLRGDRGGALLVMLLALGGTLAVTLAGKAPVNAQLFLTALAVTWTAVGGYTWLKRLIWPADKPAPASSSPPVDGTIRAVA